MIKSIVILLIVLLIVIFFHYAAKMLVVSDDIKNIENATIILLMGSSADRSLGASELYHEGKAKKILMVESWSQGTKLLKEKNINVEGSAERSKKILMELGVIEEDIFILPGDTKSTKDEAVAIMSYLLPTNEIKNIILVTSKYHSFRAKLIFKEVIKESKIRIFSVPTPYDSFRMRFWYLNRTSTIKVFEEYLKLLFFCFFDRFRN